MSTLNVSNITDGTTTVGTGYVVNGSAKAFYTTSTTFALGASLNCSSMTDNGTGNYNVSFSSAFATGNDIVGTFGPVSSVARMYGGFPVSASEVSCRMFTSSAVAADVNATGCFHGDLA